MKRAVISIFWLLAVVGCGCATALTSKSELERYLSKATPVGADLSVVQTVIREHHWKILSFARSDIASDPEKEPKLLIVSTTPDESGCSIVWAIKPDQTISEVLVSAHNEN
jgi:hypothetical protein